MVSQTYDSQYGRYYHLKNISLPGPVLIIDVRKGSEYEPPLVWNLSTELDDFMREMELQQIYRWRKLRECITLWKLNPSSAGSYEEREYTLTDPRGSWKIVQGREELTRVLIAEIDRVRGNRESAILDNESLFSSEEIDTSQPVVSVCFVADIEDQQSVSSADIYTQWLKQAMQLKLWGENEQPLNEQQRPASWEWQEPGIRTIMLCFHVNQYKHPPQLLAKIFQQVQQARQAAAEFALDKMILLYRYGENGLEIDNQMQSHLVELFLYVLSLSNWGLLDTPADQQEQQLLGMNGNIGKSWPLDLIGISSVEYSARWGTRWLDYGLTAYLCEKLLHIMPEKVRDVQDLNRHQVWLSWQNAVESFVAQALPVVFPSFGALHTLFDASGKLKRFFHEQVSPKKATTVLPALEAIQQRYAHLQEILEEADRDLEQTHRKQLPLTESSFVTLLAHWQNLLEQTTLLPAELLLPTGQGHPHPMQLEPQGLLPRASRCAALLVREIEDMEEIRQNPPDSTELSKRIDELNRLIQLHARASRARRQQKPYEARLLEQAKLVIEDLQQLQRFVEIRVKLVLLERVELWNAERHVSPYLQLLQDLTKSMQKAATAAQVIQAKAYDRLQMSLSQIQPASPSDAPRLSPRSRSDLLDWKKLSGALVNLIEKFAQPESALPLMSYCLLNLLCNANADRLLQQLGNRPRPQDLAPFGQVRRVEMEWKEELQPQKDKFQLQETGALVHAMLLASRLLPRSTRLQAPGKIYLELASKLASEPTTFALLVAEAMFDAPGSLQAGQRATETLDFAFTKHTSFEQIFAAWVNSEYITLSEYHSLLAENDLIARLRERRETFEDVLKYLIKRNNLMGGTIAEQTQQHNDYLLLPHDQYRSTRAENQGNHVNRRVKTLLFPDIEKMIYLRVSHILYQYDDDHLIASPES